eukprot:725437-Prymnesium_polylepis.3
MLREFANEVILDVLFYEQACYRPAPRQPRGEAPHPRASSTSLPRQRAYAIFAARGAFVLW